MSRSETWRSVIRIFAVTMALLGVMLIFNEIWENVTSCSAGTCQRIHLSTMLWGLTCLSYGLLVLQKGDVTMSLRDLTATGNAVATWLGRRAYDRKSAKVAVVTEQTTETAVVTITPDPSDLTTAMPTDIPTKRDD